MTVCPQLHNNLRPLISPPKSQRAVISTLNDAVTDNKASYSKQTEQWIFFLYSAYFNSILTETKKIRWDKVTKESKRKQHL